MKLFRWEWILRIDAYLIAGAAEGQIDAKHPWPALVRELQCIGATTLDEYRKHIERDGLERRFQPVMVGSHQ